MLTGKIDLAFYSYFSINIDNLSISIHNIISLSIAWEPIWLLL